MDGVSSLVVFSRFQHLVKDIILHQDEVFPIVDPAIDAVVVDGVEGLAFFINKAFGYTKIVVETPLRGAGNGERGTGNRKKPDPSKRDTENVPLGEDIGEYMKREVLPYNPDAWVDGPKSKVGYEIPFTRTFYEYKKIEASADIAKRIKEHEARLAATLDKLFGEDAK